MKENGKKFMQGIIQKNAHANYANCKLQHPPEPNAEKLAYSAEASRMSTERSFVNLKPPS